VWGAAEIGKLDGRSHLGPSEGEQVGRQVQSAGQRGDSVERIAVLFVQGKLQIPIRASLDGPIRPGVVPATLALTAPVAPSALATAAALAIALAAPATPSAPAPAATLAPAAALATPAVVGPPGGISTRTHDLGFRDDAHALATVGRVLGRRGELLKMKLDEVVHLLPMGLVVVARQEQTVRHLCLAHCTRDCCCRCNVC
jgi:hypothetical protein